MIPVPPRKAPKGFNAGCRRKGDAWLAKNPTQKPKDFWTAFKTPLRKAFGRCCGYSAMYSPVGTVDHFLSSTKHPKLAYRWGNYRLAEGWINSSKSTMDEAALDPFEVQEGWFEVLLPSLELVATSLVPKEYRERAERMLTRLHLAKGGQVIDQRQAWLALYTSGKLTLDGLATVAPLLAAAAKKAGLKPKMPRAKASKPRAKGTS